jgi:branched-chain amino acid transport system substrate-binding protein
LAGGRPAGVQGGDELIASNGRLFARGAALAVTALVLFACGGSSGGSSGGGQSFKGTKKVGLTTAISGTSATFGAAAQNGLQMAVDDVNSKGGVNGYKIQLVVRDDANKPDAATENARSLVLEDKVVGLFGPVTSSACLAISPLAKQYKVTFFTFVCNTVNLTTRKFQPYITSLVPNTVMEGSAIGIDIGKKKQYRTYYVIAPDYEFGHVEADAFKAALKKTNSDAQIIGEDYPKLGTTDFTSYITKILAAHPDVVYTNIFSADLVTFVKQAKPYDFFNKTTFTTQTSIDDLQTLGADFPLNIRGYTRAPFFAINTSQAKDYTNRYKSRFGKYPSDWAIMGYDAFNVWAAAANKAGNFDAQKIIDNTVGQSFTTLRGKVTIRKVDHQADVPEWLGTTTQSSEYPFPIYKDVEAVPGKQLWLSEDEVKKLQAEG